MRVYGEPQAPVCLHCRMGFLLVMGMAQGEYWEPACGCVSRATCREAQAQAVVQADMAAGKLLDSVLVTPIGPHGMDEAVAREIEGTDTRGLHELLRRDKLPFWPGPTRRA